MEMTTCLVTFATALFSVVAGDSIGPGLVGLSISYALELTGSLRSLCRSAAQIEAKMVCVERLWEYQRLGQEENEKETKGCPPTWPSQGEISFESFNARYREDLDLALRDLTFQVKPGEKLGVVGRTGAGKSSMALALFRMLGQTSGTIKIDGQDVDKVPLSTLRSRMSIIPQDPVLFSGSIRFNVDPFHQHSSREVAEVLQKTHLTTFADVNFQVGERGSNLSSGQRQLICLARALLRNSRSLVLDEATAAVDPETDSLVQRTIREEFGGSTIVTIAHRLDTILDSDRILVLEGGRVAEVGTPDQLKRNKSSIFSCMLRSSYGALCS